MMMLKQFLRVNTTLARASFTSRVFVEGLPLDWTHHEIAQRFGLTGSVLKVNLVKNSMGQNTGKAIVTYEKESSV